jgi:Holliday junction resolvase RusA-like endonuclease
MVKFIVEGDILGKPRPRVNRNGRVWTPDRFKAYEKKIARAYIEAGGERLSGSVSIKVRTFRSLPKSRPKRILEEEDIFKPDIDNILKIVLDALNGVAFEDDKQVVRVLCSKMPRARREEYLEVEVSSTR